MHTTRSTFAPIAAAAVLILLLAGQAAPARADVGSLLSSLTGQLGVSEDQALGGAASLFDMARSSLSSDDFSSLTDAVPGIASLADQAPEGGSAKSSGLLSSAMSQLGGTALLADRFQGLGMDPALVQKFVPVVLDWVEKEGGAAAMQLLSSAF